MDDVTALILKLRSALATAAGRYDMIAPDEDEEPSDDEDGDPIHGEIAEVEEAIAAADAHLRTVGEAG